MIQKSFEATGPNCVGIIKPCNHDAHHKYRNTVRLACPASCPDR